MTIIFDAPALVYRLRRLISRHKSRIVIDIPAYIYIFPKIAHYDSILILLFTNKCNIYIDDRLTLEEFTSGDDISEIFEIDSITEIIDSLITNNNKDSDNTQEAGFDPPPSSEKAIQGFESLTAYFECYSKDSNDIHLLNLLSKRLDILCINNKKQTTLSFVNNSK